MVWIGRGSPYEGELQGKEITPKAMFRVSVSKEDNTYTLIQEGIELTEEQVMQIHGAYEREQVRKEAERRLRELMDKKREYVSDDGKNYIY